MPPVAHRICELDRFDLERRIFPDRKVDAQESGTPLQRHFQIDLLPLLFLTNREGELDGLTLFREGFLSLFHPAKSAFPSGSSNSQRELKRTGQVPQLCGSEKGGASIRSHLKRTFDKGRVAELGNESRVESATRCRRVFPVGRIRFRGEGSGIGGIHPAHVIDEKEDDVGSFLGMPESDRTQQDENENAEKPRKSHNGSTLIQNLAYDDVLPMIKTISRIGNSRGLVFDSALLQLAHLKEGDEVNVEVHSGGTITITPIKPEPTHEDIEEAIEETMNESADTLEKLAK